MNNINILEPVDNSDYNIPTKTRLEGTLFGVRQVQAVKDQTLRHSKVRHLTSIKEQNVVNCNRVHEDVRTMLTSENKPSQCSQTTRK